MTSAAGVTETPGPPSAAGVTETPGPPLVVSVPEDPRVRVAFTRRTPDGGNLSLVVGDGNVAAARAAALGAVTAAGSSAVFMQQVHGANVAEVDQSCAGRGLADYGDAIAGVDALVTTAEGLPLVVLVADCVPVVLVDPGRAVGAVHAGRGGVASGVVPTAINRLAPGDASHVVALIGPAIGGCCYEVPQAMADAVTAGWPQAKATTTWGTPALDLPAAVEAQLVDAGVARVQRLGSCTRCSPDALFSHRAATAGAAPHGRQGAIVVREPSDPAGPAGSRQTPSVQSP